MALLSDCTPCRAGTYQPTLGQTFAAACLLCQRGQYQTGAGMTALTQCVSCSPGTYQTGLGAPRMDNCTRCPAGSFLAETGATHPQNCTSCPPGTYQTGLGATRSSNCSLCSAGTFETGVGNSLATCTACGPGTYQTGMGLSSAGSCAECEPGAYLTGFGSTRSSQCILCGAGTFLTESGASRAASCQACDAGTYQTGAGATTALNCTPCSSGEYQTGTGRTSQAFCVQCSAGTYQSAAGASGWQGCLLCGPGTYQPSLGGNSLLSCLQCARGTYQSGVGMGLAVDCRKCSAGHIQTSLSATSSQWCSPCGAGTYGPNEGAGFAENCTRCGPGNYQAGVGASAAQACVACESGKVQPASSARTNPDDCIACGPGTYASAPDASACQPCAAGTFQTGSRSTDCSLCRQGTYQSSTQVRYESWCAACERGTYQSVQGASSLDSCFDCDKGTFASETGGVSSCTACGAGTYASLTGVQLCASCPAGAYASQGGANVCDACSPGTYGNASGLTGCLQCGPGRFQGYNGSSACLLCAPGRFQTGAGTADCSLCGRGAYHQLVGQTAVDACNNCSAGSFGAEAGVSYCSACETGGYSAGTGWTACASCGPGTFQHETNRTGCVPCSPGTFSTAHGAAHPGQCASCPPGFHANESGSTACRACGTGTLQTGTGGSQCRDCSPGTFMDFEAWQRDPCTLCAPGTYSTQHGAAHEDACLLCADGLFSSRNGQNSSDACQPCSLGTMSVSNKTTCAPCPSGTYCPPGYHTPIQCFPGLLCTDGASVWAPLGFLPIVRGGCTGMIPCPPGTNCTISSDKGLLDPYPNQTHFAVFAGGDNRTDLSCPGATLDYGYDRVDWPYNSSTELYGNWSEILFWLAPLGCPAGTYLLESMCAPCPVGTYSTSTFAISLEACVPCPVGARASTVGSTGCEVCRPGEFGDTTGASSCVDCAAGSYQNSSRGTACQLCPPGEFSGASKQTGCVPCPPGTAQMDAGSETCSSCDSTQYSSEGGVRCSPCGSIRPPLDPRHECEAPRLPQNSSALWLSVRGGGNTDDCVGIGLSTLSSANSSSSSLLHLPVSLLHPNGQCNHALHVMTRPDLARAWIYQRAVLRRPVMLRVIPHNETFYPGLCARQGFGVLFTVEDETGNMHTDLSAAKATIVVLDSSGEHQLFSMGCTGLPSRLSDPVPVGTCYTSYCPRTRVMVRVTVSWSGGGVGGSALVAPGPSVWCGATASWIVTVELAAPSVPYFPGESIRLYVRMLNSPAHLAVFRFALRMLPGVTFVAFQSVYSVVYQVEQGIVSVVGDSSQGAGTTLGMLTLQIQSSLDSGVRTAVQVVPNTFQITLPDTVAYIMTVRTHGFSCRADGNLQVLVDVPRVTSLIARARRSTLIHWRNLQPWSGLSVTTGIDSVAVRNTMRGYEVGPASQCTSLHPADLLVSSCANIQAAGNGQGNPGASVRVQYQAASVLVNFTVYVPQNRTVWTANAGLYGRFKVLAHLQAGPALILRDVDATPYVVPGAPFSGPISVQNEQWACASFSAASFTVGDPVLFTGTCGENTPEPWIAQLTVFLFTGGTPSLGRFLLSKSELSSETSSGGVLLLAGPLGLPLHIHTTSIRPSPALATFTAIDGSETRMTMVRSGASARCMPVLAGVIPVYPPSPVSLRVSLSATTLVSTNETFTGLLPLSTSVTRAVLNFSDGAALDIKGDPRFQMAVSGGARALLNISGLVATAGPEAGNASLVFSVLGIPCVTTSVVVRVLAYSIQSSTLVCPLCPNVLTTTADPLGMQFPVTYPSSIPETLFIVRRLLTDGTVLRRFEPLFVSGNGSLVNGRVLGLSGGYVVITTNFTTGEPYALPVVWRWAVSWRLICNQRLVCSEDMKLAPPGDGAALAPFSYTTSLALSLSLTLFNGNTANFSWLAGAAVTSNQTELTNVGAKEIPLYYGTLAVRAFFNERWQLQDATRVLNLRVERLATILIVGPPVLYQMHCSLMWEEGGYNASGVLTDGVERMVPADFTATTPLAVHASPRQGLIHADWAGVGQIIAVFGPHSGSVFVHATQSSRYFVSVALDFLPNQWSVPLDQPLPAQPLLYPVFWQGAQPWFIFTNLTSRVLQWASSAPDVIRAGPVSLQLLADYHQPVIVTASLTACDSAPSLSVSKEVVVNVVPDTPGQIDFGQETGAPVVPVGLGQLMAIPIYLYAPARLRSYTVEIRVDGAAFEAADCTPGALLNSQCAVNQDSPVVFRAVGAMLHSQMTGRLLISTITGRPLKDTVGGMSVRVLQSVVGEQVLPDREFMFGLRMGTGPLAYPLPPPFITPAAFSPDIVYQGGAYGDTDGDGLFTGLDVLFMEHYSAVAVFEGEQQICTTRGRCQLRSQLTPWQLMQLKPVRAPNMPATPPDGSDLLFLLRALVGKAYFLTSLDIRSHPGELRVSLSLRDHLQQVNPANAMAQIQLVTSSNRDIAFDTPSEYNATTSVLSVDCRREGQSFAIATLATAVTSDEPLVAMRVVTRALDRFGSQESAAGQDRRFVFLPGAPLARFNILAPIHSRLFEIPWISYIPTESCQTLCDDASLFADNTLAPPEWLNDTALTAPFAMHPPLFQGFWPGVVVDLEDAWTPPPTRFTVPVVPANTPAAGAILVGTRFNLTFEPPPGINMAAFRVESTYATLVRVHHGAEAVGNTFFMQPARSSSAHFELILHQAGPNLPIRVFTLNALPFETFPPNTLAHTALVTGYVPAITSLRVEILCRAGVILWSVLGGADESCDVLITPLWTPATAATGVQVTCQAYPCVLQAFSQTVRPIIQTYTPTNPRLFIQRSLISLGQRLQWRAVCDLGGISLTVTQRALGAGVIQVSPANALAIARDSIRGARLGPAVVRFGNSLSNASVGINVTSDANPPQSLKGFVFSGIHVGVSANQVVTAVFQVGAPLVAGQRGYILVQAVYSGGYSLLLDPRPSPSSGGGLSLMNASQYVIPSQIDGSFTLRKDAQSGTDQPIVTVQFQGVSLTIRADIIVAMPPLPEPAPTTTTSATPAFITTTPVWDAPTINNNNTTVAAPDVQVVHLGAGRLQLNLVGLGITGFYIQLQVDGILLALTAQSCSPAPGLPLFSDCAVDPVLHMVFLAAASVTALGNRTELALLEFNGTFTGAWGFVEVHTGFASVRYPLATGAVHHPMIDSRPPTVDATALNRRYTEIFLATSPETHTRSPFYRALFSLFMLTDRQRNVDARLYSNEFELSAMFRVMDRFLEPDTDGNHSLLVTFHTDTLPPLPGSTLIPGVGLRVPATHVMDGWYIVEWRQQIPAIPALTVSFTLETRSLHYAWPWDVSDSLRTGLALASCPRAATDIGTFLMTYEITAPVDVPQTLLDKIACSVQVVGRRVLLGPPDQGTGMRTLSIGLESMARVHQANLVVMSDWLTEQLPGIVVRRGELRYINDTRDPAIPCPQGVYFTNNGSYQRLPMHAVAGPDCYDLRCVGGYALAPETQRCIPVPVSTDLAWICILMVTTLVLAVSAIIFCVQLAAYCRTPEGEAVVFEPGVEPQFGCAPDDASGENCQNVENCPQYHHIVTGVVLDDYSVMMLDDDDFSPVPLDDSDFSPGPLDKTGGFVRPCQ